MTQSTGAQQTGIGAMAFRMYLDSNALYQMVERRDDVEAVHTVCLERFPAAKIASRY